MKILKLTLLMILPFLHLFAQEESFEELLETLQEVNQVATQSRLGIDKSPSMVTVLYGDKLEELHIETLTEALALVPGIEISMSNSGIKQIVMRGVKSPYRDKIKLMIDGVEVNNDFYDNQYYYLNFPVDLIDRIEIIRGPGSVLYGENAFIGVIDVITKIDRDGNESQGSYRYDTLKERHTITLYENKKIGNWNV
ncbi:TonB-dependent receptor plug domain-containing protein [Hydrogenimonas thermophila]|nr:TonB-dependent receptor plug domain-containing protein [Hydrogenimonas thermophila]WOE72298.1 TonB-dependent receptor plug domain-containing protein [Hydrogenimonas thermophila]